VLDKPDRIFDRDVEWGNLVTFAARATDRPQLGVVSGRRRQGKTYLLEALTRAMGGLYFGATEATEAESLSLFGEALGAHTGAEVPPRSACRRRSACRTFWRFVVSGAVIEGPVRSGG